MSPTRLLPLLLPLLALSLSAQAQKLAEAQADDADALDPNEWVIESYRFPDERLVRGFASEELGALVAPPLPADEADREEWEDFVKRSSSIAKHYLEQQGLSFPEGSLLVFDPETMTLAARLPRISQSSIAFTSDALIDQCQHYLSFDHDILEAPADQVRDLLKRYAAKSGRGDMLAELEEMADVGEATFITSGKVDTRSGQRTKVQAVTEFASPTDLEGNLGSWSDFGSQIRSVGTIIELDPVIGNDGRSIDINRQ